MLTRLHVRAYKAFEALTATLEPLTVVSGPSGCGKTSLLDSIMMVRDFVMLDVDEAREAHPFDEVRSTVGKPAAAIGAELWVKPVERVAVHRRAQESSAYQGYVEELSDPGGGRTLRAWLEYSAEGRPSVAARMVPSASDLELQREVIGASLGRMRRLDLDVRALRRPSYSSARVPRLASDGAGLATVVSWVQGERPQAFERIQQRLRELVPELERIRVRRALVDHGSPAEGATGPEVRRVMGQQLVFDFRHASGVIASHASEGILLLLGLVTVTTLEDVSILLLDHFERALHPQAQRHLVQYLREITEGGTQVITTSPSPFFLLHFQPDEIRAMVMTEGGAWVGKLAALAQRPEYERWQDEMGPSEFSTVLGDDWLQKIRSGIAVS